jgi:hypothetical protein
MSEEDKAIKVNKPENPDEDSYLDMSAFLLAYANAVVRYLAYVQYLAENKDENA